MKKIIKPLVMLSIYVFSLLILFLIGILTNVIDTRPIELEVFSSDWNFEEIVAYSGAPYPEGATDITYKSNRFQRTFFIELEFKAPPEQAVAFAEGVCNDVLYQGFQPFVSKQYSYTEPSVMILSAWSIEYRNVDQSQKTIFGNVCLNYQAKVPRFHYILLDTSDSELFKIRYGVPQGDNSIQWSAPEADYINPIDRIPFMIAGLRETNDGNYELTTNRICFESRREYSYYASTNNNTFPPNLYPAQLLNSEITIYINNLLISDGIISHYWNILDKNDTILKSYDKNVLTYPQDHIYENHLFRQCYFQENWVAGEYDIKIIMNNIEYTLSFGVN